MCDSVNHTRFPKKDHIPDWVCRDKHCNKGDHEEHVSWKAEFSLNANQTIILSAVDTVTVSFPS